MIKAIIFDLDNTLTDFIKMKRLSVEAAASAMIDAGLDMKAERIMRKLFKLYDQLGWEHQTIFQKFLQEETKTIDYRILAYAINAYRRVRVGFLEPYPHVIATLQKLKEKGITLAIVSDAPKIQAWMRLSAMKIDYFFDTVVTFDDTKQKKPSPKPFEVALKKLRLPPEDCLMVGDMPERDIMGAKKMGMQTCFAKYGHRKGKKIVKADYELNDILDLLKIVK